MSSVRHAFVLQLVGDYEDILTPLNTLQHSLVPHLLCIIVNFFGVPALPLSLPLNSEFLSQCEYLFQ